MHKTYKNVNNSFSFNVYSIVLTVLKFGSVLLISLSTKYWFMCQCRVQRSYRVYKEAYL